MDESAKVHQLVLLKMNGVITLMKTVVNHANLFANAYALVHVEKLAANHRKSKHGE